MPVEAQKLQGRRADKDSRPRGEARQRPGARPGAQKLGFPPLCEGGTVCRDMDRAGDWTRAGGLLGERPAEGCPRGRLGAFGRVGPPPGPPGVGSRGGSRLAVSGTAPCRTSLPAVATRAP